MPTRFLLLLILTVFISCNSSQPNETQTTKEQLVKKPLPSLESFADSVVRLDQFAPEGIGRAGYYFNRLVPADSTLADSAAAMLLIYAWKIADTVNQKLWTDTTDYTQLLYSGGDLPTQKQKDIQLAFKKNHLILQGNGEGDAVAVLDYEWLTTLVQPKVSGAVNSYLLLVGNEEKAPVLQDAGLAVDIKELIDRLVAGEALLSQNLPYRFRESLLQKNKFYTDVLFVGASNTPAFSNELALQLSPEFKSGYDYLLRRYPSTKAAQEPKAWLGAIKAKDHTTVEQRLSEAYQ